MESPDSGASPESGVSTRRSQSVLRWLVFGIAVLNIVLFLVFSRRQSGTPAASPPPVEAADRK